MKVTDNNYSAMLNEMQLVWGNDQHMIDYCVKEASEVITLTDGRLVSFTQPRIEKNFCFGYHTDYDGKQHSGALKAENAARRDMENFFLAQNRRRAGYDDKIKELQDEHKNLYLQIHYTHGQNLMAWHVLTEWQTQQAPWRFTSIELSQHQAEDKALIIEALKREQAKHEKRVAAWFKRYGADKIRTWTYWLDE